MGLLQSGQEALSRTRNGGPEGLVSMIGETRGELVERCNSLLADGQQVTARIEQLLQNAPRDGDEFDRQLKRLQREHETIHSRLERVMEQLQALEDAAGG